MVSYHWLPLGLRKWSIFKYWVIFVENHISFGENVAPVFTQLKSEFHVNRICSTIVSQTDKITNSNKSSSTNRNHPFRNLRTQKIPKKLLAFKNSQTVRPEKLPNWLPKNKKYEVFDGSCLALFTVELTFWLPRVQTFRVSVEFSLFVMVIQYDSY